MTSAQNALALNTGAAAITALIDGQAYATSDASSGGVNVYGVNGHYVPGQQVALVLNVPFRTFSLDVNLAAEVQSYDAADQSLGLLFPNLNTDHTAHLNRALKAYSSGDVIATNSLSKTVSHDNFMKVAKLAEPSAPMAPQAKKQVVGMSLATLLGLAALAFIAYNIYSGVYTINSVDAVVSGTTIPVRAPLSGVYTSLLGDDALSVTADEELGSIAGASGPVTSPCECLVTQQDVTSGEYVAAGEKILSLVPVNGKRWIIAEVEAERALRIGAATTVAVTIAGSEIEYTGKVVSVASAMNTPSIPGVVQKTARVKVMLDQEIPAEFVGKPAQAVFTVK